MTEQDLDRLHRQILDHAEAAAKRVMDSANEQAERMLKMNVPFWERQWDKPPADKEARALAIAEELMHDTELRARVMALVGPVPPGPG